MMGADAPIPPVVMNGRRPEGRPAAASTPFSETVLAPPRPISGPDEWSTRTQSRYICFSPCGSNQKKIVFADNSVEIQ